jgi:hypothetical protein
MDMLCLMHEGEPYGHLATVGGALTNEQVARMTGISVGRLRKLLYELETAGVSSRTASGLLFSRRMVKDERIREVRAQSGKMGGNPALLVKPEVDGKVKQVPTPASASAFAVAKQPLHTRRDAMMAKFQQEPDRWAVVEFLEHVPRAEAWVPILTNLLDGLGMPQGKAATPGAVVLTCRQFLTKHPSEINPRFFGIACAKNMTTRDGERPSPLSDFQAPEPRGAA